MRLCGLYGPIRFFCLEPLAYCYSGMLAFGPSRFRKVKRNDFFLTYFGGKTEGENTRVLAFESKTALFRSPL
jgi:hypothetical protein